MSNEIVRLGNIATVISKGTTPTSIGFSYSNSGIPFLRSEDILGGEVNHRTVARHIDANVHSALARSALQTGDVLVTIAGTIGRTAYVSEGSGELNCNQAVAFIRFPNGIIEPAYVAYALSASSVQDYFKGATAGGAIPNVNLEQINSVQIRLPKLADQRRIAAHLKAQLATIEETRNAAQGQLRESKRLTPTILKAAFAEVADAEMVKVGDVAPTTSGSTPSRSQKDYWEPGKYPWVKTGEVAFVPISSTEEKISEKALKECSLSLLPSGTVLVAMYGQGKTRGQSAVLEVAATTNQACFAILPNDTFDPEYLQFWLRRSYDDLRALSDARGGNQSNLNGSILNAFEVPLLPREQQVSIAKRIKAAIVEANALQSVLEKQLTEIELLSSRLLAQAFES